MQKYPVKVETSNLGRLSVPTLDFPALPSAYYYYLTAQGIRIPVLNNVGTEDERRISAQIWYSFKSNDVYPVSVSYAHSEFRKFSSLSASMRDSARQVPDDSEWFFDDGFQIIMGQTRHPSVEPLIYDIYRFPLNPASDPFEVSRLILEYLQTGDSTSIKSYLGRIGASHLVNLSLDYYPIYYLFFYLTRLASYPFNNDQIWLVEKRNLTTLGSHARYFIDSIFEIPLTEKSRQLVELLVEGKIQEAGDLVLSSDPAWTRWGDEYLREFTHQKVDWRQSLNEIVPRLMSWSDRDLDTLAEELKLQLPFKREFFNRYDYLETVGSIFKKKII